MKKEPMDPRLEAAGEVVRLYRLSTFVDIPDEDAEDVFEEYEAALENLSRVWGESPLPVRKHP